MCVWCAPKNMNLTLFCFFQTTGNLYTPVPEPIESCKVTVVAENSDLEQIS